MPVAPFRVFGAAARPASLPAWVVLLWNRLLVQSIWPAEVQSSLLRWSRFAVGPCPGCAVFLERAAPATVKLPATSSRRASPSFRVLPSNTYPTAAAIRSSHGLCVPSAHSRIRGPLLASPKRLATFRLQGLVTLLTAYSLESRAGSFSHRQHSWDSPLRRFHLPTGFHGLSAGKNPLTVSSAVSSGTEAPDRPAKPQFLGSRLSEVPCDRGFLSRRPPAPPLGFTPPGPPTTTLTRISPSLLSHASRVLAITRRIRRRLRVSIGCRFASPDDRQNEHRPKPPSWGFCTCLILSIRAFRCLGYSLHLAPGRALLPAHRCSWGIVAPYRSCSGSVLGAEHRDLHVAELV